MKKITILIMVLLLLFVPSVFSQEETYTKEQYIAMLPTLNKVDLSKMENISVETTLKHRTWYYGEISTEIAERFRIYSLPSKYVVGLYVWNLQNDEEYIVVIWNATTNNVFDVTWIKNDDVLLTDYPKTIADYSIKDLPLIKTSIIYDFIPYIIIVGCLIAVVAYLSKDLEI